MQNRPIFCFLLLLPALLRAQQRFRSYPLLINHASAKGLIVTTQLSCLVDSGKGADAREIGEILCCTKIPALKYSG